MIKKLVIAYIGNGKSTNRYHLPFALKLPEKIEVKTIYSRKDNSPWDKIAGIKYTNDINDIYNDPEIDCVVATVPAVAHMEIANEPVQARLNHKAYNSPDFFLFIPLITPVTNNITVNENDFE